MSKVATKKPAVKLVKTKIVKIRRRKRATAAEKKAWKPFRKLLLVMQEECTQAYINSTGDSRPERDGGTEDYIDYAVNSYTREFFLSLSELDRQNLQEIQAALRRIETGDYGRCRNCSREIPPKRLEVAPASSYCVPCQELSDRGMLDLDDLDDEDEFEETITEKVVEQSSGQDEEDDEEDYEAEVAVGDGKSVDEDEPDDLAD